MKEHIQSFNRGIQQDLSTNKYPRDNVYWAQNFRLVSKDGLATGALTNVAGNNKVLSLGGETEQVYEMCLIRDTLVIFVGSDDGGKIYIWEHNNTDFETESPKLVYYSPDLIFSMEHPVRAIGRYENEKVQKIYFSDGTTFFKHLNIVHPTLGLGAQLDYDLKSLDLVSDVNFSTMSLELESGGDLKAGKIQYAYQLYSVRGSESMFSPASKLIHLTNADESKNSQYYYGDEVGTSVNKSVSITIDSIDPLFTRLRLVALEYTVLYQQPSIRIVGEYDINNLKSITISDTGSSIGSLTNEEFLFIQNNFYPKTLDIKDDYLFAANILNDYFDITDEEFDARAWRANSSDEVYVVNGTNAPTPIPYPFSNDTIPAQGSEQFNSFNDISNDWSNNNKAVDSTSRDAQCKYKPGSGGTILGGAGINISYEFTIDQQILDNTQKSYNYGSVGGNYPKLSVGADPIENNASPYSNIGYHRDEIYRFGIVFFDKKGRQSFVKWIGDIRFPANYDQDSINTNYNYVQYDSTNNQTLVNILGIKFTVNIPLNVQNKISGYQIVRAERTNRDKTIIAQGLIGYPTYSTAPSLEQLDMIYSQPTPSLMDNMVAKVSRIERQCDIYNGIAQADKSQFKETNTKYDTRWIEFDSPDIVINKPKLSTTDSFIELFGYQNNVESTAISGTRGYEGITNSYPAADYRLDQRDILTADKSRNIENNPTVVKTRSFINTSRIYQPKTRGNADGVSEFDATKTVIEGGQKHNNLCYLYTLGSDSRDKVGLRGTHALLTVEDELPLDSSWLSPGTDDIRFPIANYRIERGRSMYGGSTSEDRSTTKYYPASEFVNMNNIPNVGDIDEVVREEITTAFTVKYGALPGNACTGTEATVYCAFTKPEVGDILYADESLTTPWTTTNGSALLFTSPAIFGNEVVGVAIVTGTIYALGEIMLKTTWACGNTPGYITDDDPNSISVFNGDTYISYFVYLRSIYDHEAGNGSRIETYVFYPVESTINLHLRLDKMQEYINWGFFRDSGVTDYKLMENVAMGISVYGTNYPSDVGNLYRYNTAYSSVDKSKEYYPKPFDFTQTLLEDVKITASEKKINGEYIDSWTKFKFNNYINVDSKHNAITKILTFKNNLYYVQPTAVGIASVNQRSLIQDGQPGQLSLGTGGILPRYDYITDKSGSEFYDGIIATDDFLFYVDGRRKRANKLVPGKEEAVSVIKGIDSTLDKLPFNKVSVGFDRGYNEVLFSIDGVTLSFSEISDGFVSTYTFNPGKMISIGGEFYTTAPFEDESPWLYADNELEKVGYSGNTDADPNWDYIIIGPSGSGTGLFKHNVGNPGEFYGGEAADDSYITLIINPNGNQVCYFDNLDLRTEATNAGVDQPDDIFYTMEASNNYQNISRELSFSSSVNQNVGTVKRIGRVWRTPIMPIAASKVSTNRMVDTYLKVTLRYDNSSGNVFRVHDIGVMYRPANH